MLLIFLMIPSNNNTYLNWQIATSNKSIVSLIMYYNYSKTL